MIPWHDLVKKVFGSMGLHPCPHSPCVFTGTPIPGQPPIYIATYVDDMCYFSASDAVEQWFETTLQSNLRVDIMGPVEWFLGTYYEWNVDPATRDVSCHMSQAATVDALLETNQMAVVIELSLPIAQVQRLILWPQRNIPLPPSLRSTNPWSVP